MGEFSKAMEKLQFALKMEPKNMEIIKEIRIVSCNEIKYIALENISCM